MAKIRAKNCPSDHYPGGKQYVVAQSPVPLHRKLPCPKGERGKHGWPDKPEQFETVKQKDHLFPTNILNNILCIIKANWY